MTSTIRSEEHDLDHDNNAQGDRAALLAMLEGAEDGAGELELVGGSQKAVSELQGLEQMFGGRGRVQILRPSPLRRGTSSRM